MPRRFVAGITDGMKVAVSIPDDVFAEADRVAEELGATRSALYSRALKAYLQTVTREGTTEALNAVVDAVGTADLAFSQTAARRRLLQTEW